jgi:hypothetical protein
MSHTEKIIVIDGARTGGCRKSLFPRTWDIGPNVMNHTFVLITCVNAATHTGSDRRWLWSATFHGLDPMARPMDHSVMSFTGSGR